MDEQEVTKLLKLEQQNITKTEPSSSPASDQRLLFIVLAILVFISLSEYLSTTLATVQIGLVGHGLALVALLLSAGLIADPKEQRIYLTLSFAPLIRLISLSLPMQGLPMIYWYLMVGFLVYIAIFFVIRYGRFSLKQSGLTARYWFLQLLFGLVGIGLGYLEYLILKPEPLVKEMTWAQLWFPALILLVFTGILEELVFRGLMQSAFAAKINRWLGMVLISVLFAVLHLGYQSLLDVIFVFGVAVVFGILTELTGSILGVSLAHGLTNITLFLVFPFIIGQGLQPFPELNFLEMNRGSAQVSPPINETQSPFVLVKELTPTPSLTITLTPTPTPRLEIARVSETPTPSVTLTLTKENIVILVDDDDPGFEWEGGKRWEVSQAYGGSLLWAFSRFDKPDVSVLWKPEIQYCGRYLFEVYIPEDYGLAQAVTYSVVHRDDLTETEVNQSIHQAKWVSLGSFWCDKGTACQVSANNLMDFEYPTTFISFDALRLTLLEACP